MSKKGESWTVRQRENHVTSQGYKHTEEALIKIKEASINRLHTDETKRKLSIANTLSRHPQWLGGKTFEPRPLGWNVTFREQIRYRDNYQCRICGVSEVELCCKLDVHHIDYDKDNLNHRDLICLCRSCHSKTNFNREYWEEYFGANN